MKCVVLYDSQFGNTEKIAKAVVEEIPRAEFIRVAEANINGLESVDLLLVGSPTQGGKATVTMSQFLDLLPNKVLAKIKVATFDTRLREEDQNFALRLLIRTIGYAAPKIADVLKNKGAYLLVPPEGFFVKGKDGPLLTGELERARRWGRAIYAKKE
jgi:flavodoxin